MLLKEVSNHYQYQQYLALRGVKVSQSLQARKDRGEVTGPAPLGLMIVTDKDKRKRYVPDPEIWPKVRELILLDRKGFLSVRDLVMHAEAIGLKSKRGNDIVISSMHLILRNEVYEPFLRQDRYNDLKLAES